MAGFLEKAFESFTHSGGQGQGQGGAGGYGGSGYNQGGYGGSQAPPQPPYPWIARWDDRESRYIFINEQTGERSWSMPRAGYGGGGYEQRDEGAYYGGAPQQGYGSGPYQEERREEKKHGGHGMAYAGLSAAAGLAGGALLMHEGEDIKNDYERDKYRVEGNFDQFGNRVEGDVENFPENAANWTGRKVGEVEDIPQDVEQGFDRFGNRIESGFDNAVDDVEDAPERMAGWAGDKVGDVERFDDNIDNSYDQGKYEGRNDYDDY